MATFSYIPSFGASSQNTPRIRSLKFGDGYEQRYGDGLNPILQTWNLSFNNRPVSDIDAIEAFLVGRGGVKNFLWTPPRQSTAKRFICKEWQRAITAGGIDTITAMFEQVADNVDDV